MICYADDKMAQKRRGGHKIQTSLMIAGFLTMAASERGIAQSIILFTGR